MPRRPRTTPRKKPRQQRSQETVDCILDATARVLCTTGYDHASTNRVAMAAGVSVGSLYQYFRTKENLFLTLIEESHETLTTVINNIFARMPGFFERVEALLRAAIEWSRKDPDLLNLYISGTTQELSPLAAKISRRIESVAADSYRQMVAKARAGGEIAPGCSDKVAAFCLDNLFLIVQFSFGSAYYKERLRLFLGERAAVDAEAIVRGVMSFIRQALGQPGFLP